MSAVERKLLMIVGPTASGKTELALRLAQNIPLCLISVDSMQIYTGMDIGTAKPPLDQRKQFALIDGVLPGSPYSAGRFARDATMLCEKAWGESRLPCLVGGSGLYLRSLLQGTADIPPIPSEIRNYVDAMPVDLRIAALLQQDPETAAKIVLQNPRRVSRALEVILATGKGLAKWQSESHRFALSFSNSLGFCISLETPELNERIHRRNQKAMADGWLEETRQLAQTYSAEAIRATGAIGYSELLDVLAGSLTLSAAAEQIEMRTRQYARRQRTWFRREPGLTWSANPAEIEKASYQFAKG